MQTSSKKPDQQSASAKQVQTTQVLNEQKFEQGQQAVRSGAHATSTAVSFSAKKNRKKLWIALGVIVGVLALAYVVGAAYFSSHFFPHTAFAQEDVSFKSTDEFANDINSWVSDYVLSVEGENFSATLDADQAGLDIDSAQVAKNSCANQNVWAWPVEALLRHDVSDTMEAIFNAENAHRVISDAVNAFNEDATPSKDATIVFDANKDACVIQSEVYGQQISEDALLTKVDACLVKLESTCQVTKDDLIKPSILAGDDRLNAALEKANNITGGTLKFTLNGSVDAGSLSKADIAEWIIVNKDVQIELNEDAIQKWASNEGKKFNTYQTKRTWVRADGKTCSASGGTFGWIVDVDDLASTIADHLNNADLSIIDIPCSQTADVYNGQGARDWDAYVDIDLSEQVVRYYDKNDDLVHTAHCITGNPSKENATPSGVYKLNSNNGSSTLIGEMTSSGEPSYRTKVDYWMPFIGNSIGLHDAPWQAWESWSSSKYKSTGSHGCVNLSTSDAKWFHDNLSKGVCVITHT